MGVPRVSTDQAGEACCDLLLAFGAHACSSCSSGLVQVILSLAELTNALENDVKERLPKTPSRFVFHPRFRSMLRDSRPRPAASIRTKDMDTIITRGRTLWNSIYEPYEDKLHDKLSSYHPDFMGEYTVVSSLFGSIFVFLFPDLWDRWRHFVFRAPLYGCVPFRVRLSWSNRRNGREPCWPLSKLNLFTPRTAHGTPADI